MKGKKTDLWAAGVTLYYMVMKELPFMAQSYEELKHKVFNVELV
jgi:serine/threonine protein kinase